MLTRFPVGGDSGSNLSERFDRGVARYVDNYKALNEGHVCLEGRKWGCDFEDQFSRGLPAICGSSALRERRTFTTLPAIAGRDSGARGIHRANLERCRLSLPE